MKPYIFFKTNDLRQSFDLEEFEDDATAARHAVAMIDRDHYRSIEVWDGVKGTMVDGLLGLLGQTRSPQPVWAGR